MANKMIFRQLLAFLVMIGIFQNREAKTSEVPPKPSSCPEPLTQTASGPPGTIDQSNPLKTSSLGVGLSLHSVSSNDHILCGVVSEIRAPRSASEMPPWMTVVFESSPGQEQQSFLIYVPEPLALPFKKGDFISIKLSFRQERIHHLVDGTITDKTGRLLMAHSESGLIDFAPGWSVLQRDVIKSGKAHMKGGAQRQEHKMALSCLGRTALVDSEKWRRLDTPEGAWAVNASGISWSPGPRPPDASSYMQFSMIRMQDPR